MSGQRSIFFQQVVILSACALLDLTAGSVLEHMRHSLEALPGLIILVPPLIDMRGNIGCALGSRLGTALHLGTIKPRLAITHELKINVLSAIIVSVLASFAVGILSFTIGVLANQAVGPPYIFVFIALFAGILSGLILIPITVIITTVAYRRRWDPDNVTAPLMTTLGDIVAILCIFLAVVLVGWLGW